MVLQRLDAQMLKRIAWRVYQDFFMSSRLGEYERLLQQLLGQGYVVMRVSDLAACARQGVMPEPACVLRIDVDSDLATARQMFTIAQALGVRATYYFRRSTTDAGLMRQIAAQGSEVGFHYEELATFAKRLGLRSKAEVDDALPAIRREFAANLRDFAAQLGRLPETIASHGDFINRRLRLANHYAIDVAQREHFGLIAEAYDEWLNAPVRARFSDQGPPEWWTPSAPEEAIARRVSCLLLLVHPRQWRANAVENLRLNMERAVQDVVWWVAGALRPHRPLPPRDSSVPTGSGSPPERTVRRPPQ
jgi:hypothetical protein